MVWQLQETWALQVECSSSILPIAWRHTTNICLVYTKFNALSYGYKFLFFGWPIALHGLVHFLNTSSLRLFWPHLTWMYMNVYRAYGPMGLWGHKLLNILCLFIQKTGCLVGSSTAAFASLVRMSSESLKSKNEQTSPRDSTSFHRFGASEAFRSHQARQRTHGSSTDRRIGFKPLSSMKEVLFRNGNCGGL